MPSFSDIASAIKLPACCMRKNPTAKQQLNEDVRMLGISFCLYLISYWYEFHTLCLLSMATMNLLAFQLGITFNHVYSMSIHIDEFKKLDSSMEADDDDNQDCLSLKQRQQGATKSKALTEEQEEKLNEQLQRVVEETNLRNRKRASVTNPRTPSSSTLVDDAAAAQSGSATNEDDYSDMPDLMEPEKEKTPVVRNAYTVNYSRSDIPNFSQTHYLHNYMDEMD